MSRIILGVDPGLALTGLGLLLEKEDGTISHIDHTIIATKPKYPTHDRLGHLFHDAKNWLQNYQIDTFAIEQLFVGINRNTIIKLSMARSMLMLLANIHNANTVDIPTKIVKQKIAGKGDANKKDVNKEVCSLLNVMVEQQDCTDALACALCCCNQFTKE